MKIGSLDPATVNFGHQQVSTVNLRRGEYVKVHFYGLDPVVELHVDHDGIARVVVDDRSIVHTHKEIYGT